VRFAQGSSSLAAPVPAFSRARRRCLREVTAAHHSSGLPRAPASADGRRFSKLPPFRKRRISQTLELHQLADEARRAAGLVAGRFGNTQERTIAPARYKRLGLPRKEWRRRPDLNRGWRFCRFREVVYRVGWLRLLVPDASRFSLVFGRQWPQIWTHVVGRRRCQSFALPIPPRVDGSECSVMESRSSRVHADPRYTMSLANRDAALETRTQQDSTTTT